ncbi:MAG: hypothetical protein IT207_03535 [Fimbriimonadaceae bacterium]|nr:hypothetical protein [Fimbriimonadaceae bacterium]
MIAALLLAVIASDSPTEVDRLLSAYTAGFEAPRATIAYSPLAHYRYPFAGHPAVNPFLGLGSPGPTANPLVASRRSLALAGADFEEGLVSLRPEYTVPEPYDVSLSRTDKRPPRLPNTRKPMPPWRVSFWENWKSAPPWGKPQYDRVWVPGLDKAGVFDRAAAAVRSAPDDVYLEKLDTVEFRARGVRFRKASCADCHGDVKPGELAAMAVAVTHRRGR